MNESYENLKQAEEYIALLMKKIEELELQISTLNKQLLEWKSKPAPTTDVSGYEIKITELEVQIKRYVLEITQFTKSIEEYRLYIEEL